MGFFSRKSEHQGLYPEIDRELWIDMLLRAAAQGSVPAVRALIDRGLSVDEKNDVEFTPLMAAARNYRFEMVRFLLERGADVHRYDIYGHAVLHCAVMSPTQELEVQAQCVRAILDRHPLLDSQDESGCTPLMHAAWFGLEPSVLLLVNAGADQGVTTSFSGVDPICVNLCPSVVELPCLKNSCSFGSIHGYFAPYAHRARPARRRL